MNRDLAASDNFAEMLQSAGFTDITVIHQDWPVGAWAKGRKNKDLGRMLAENFREGSANSIKMFTGVLGWVRYSWV